MEYIDIMEEFENLSYYVEAEDSELNTSKVKTTYIMRDNLYPKIEAALSTNVGDRKFKQLAGNFLDKNSEKLHTPGPLYMIPFADNDKAQYFDLFKVTPKEVTDLVTKITQQINQASDFKLLTGNPIFWVFCCCIIYYSKKNDQKGLNTALAIYALANYPAVFHVFFKYEPNAAVMQYTMDNISKKFKFKQGKHLFGGLFLSITSSYNFLKDYLMDGSDKEMIRFIQRIRNDQKSMMRNITDKYMQNHAKGLRIKLSKDSYDEVQLDMDAENNSTVVENVASNIVNQIITNGLDLKRVTQSKELGGIGMSDCRFYLSKIVTVEYTKEIEAFIYAVLFLFLYDEHKKREDINSSYFLKWSSELFRKTNSNNDNIKTIKDTLDKWAEESGVHAKFKREASRINYKKAIFWYFILSIQYFNK